MDLIDPGTHGSTFGGNPLATAIAPQAVEIIRGENLLKNARVKGERFRKELTPFVVSGALKDVRGVGLLNAIEFEQPQDAEKLVETCMEKGLLTKVTRDGTIRMCPPLTISDFEMERSLGIIKECIEEVSGR
jgi:ornithine--oxo-acid transaminase